ncbi:hypothetical protein CDAR_297051 [Caerostris darwini]|uniref:4'-phosphopantetheinyl transferase domain-containing protein n=1 Tax=Caerostris darwini TaxID=1538125 RepID=A0AAV4Q984_9ARAC|nr:hypothetical protein CDAR_297051 [Caerostris darwini]
MSYTPPHLFPRSNNVNAFSYKDLETRLSENMGTVAGASVQFWKIWQWKEEIYKDALEGGRRWRGIVVLESPPSLDLEISGSDYFREPSVTVLGEAQIGEFSILAFECFNSPGTRGFRPLVDNATDST